ncbi:MAG TPA: ABC transporter permease [Vicinamibacterales bacterium]|nr:ABC transporter permease [Vicinamibacterales bacterium]
MNLDAGARLIDDVARDVRYAIRSFRRAPLVALTIVATVGLGLGLVTVVFTILNAFVFRVDEVRNPHELFGVERERPAASETAGFTRAQYDALVRETGVFSDTFARTGDIDAWIDGRRMEGPLVTGNFFDVLGVAAARGRTLTPSDDEPGAPPAIVLSHLAWARYFASDPGVLRGPVLLNGAQVHVVGVMPERFRGLSIVAPDYWAPLSLASEVGRGDQAPDTALSIVGRLKPGMSREQALAQLLVWDSQQAQRSADVRAPKLLVEPRQGNVLLTTGVMMPFIPLFFAFGLILMIAWANVANLLLARAVARQREIGIRLAVGASRKRIIRQLLTESVVLALVSAAFGLGISRLVLNFSVYVVMRTWDSAFGALRLTVPPADWRIVLFLVGGAITSTLFFALAPAIRATRLELVRAMRGEMVRDARPGRARNTLVALQVTGSALLLICAAIFLRSAWALAAIDPGFRTTDTMSVTVLNEQKRSAVLDAVKVDPSVAAVAASWPAVMGGRRAFASAASGKSAVTYQFVSAEYFGVLGIDLVRGRTFTPSESAAGGGGVVVSENVARQLWPAIEPLGQHVELDLDRSSTPQAQGPPLLSRGFTVVGVARDVPGFQLGGQELVGAGIYVPISPEVAKTSLTVRVRGDSERARHALVDRLAAIDPNMAEVITLRTIARIVTYVMGIPFWLTLVLGALALLLTVSGLFSVVSYLVEQRTREIGVRMALGATGRGIALLVLVQSARPVAVGLALGVALASGFGAALLASPGAELIGSAVRLFDPLAYAASLFCIIIACVCAALVPALRAGRIDPMAALRQN